MGKKLSPYQRIVRNARKGRGVRLSVDEVRDMSMDGAIEQVATNDDVSDEERADDARAWQEGRK